MCTWFVNLGITFIDNSIMQLKCILSAWECIQWWIWMQQAFVRFPFIDEFRKLQKISNEFWRVFYGKCWCGGGVQNRQPPFQRIDSHSRHLGFPSFFVRFPVWSPTLQRHFRSDLFYFYFWRRLESLFFCLSLAMWHLSTKLWILIFPLALSSERLETVQRRLFESKF